jgi:thioredoxin reductase
METSIPGIFAAGDIVSGSVKQVVVAASQGAIAALSAIKYINKNK